MKFKAAKIFFLSTSVLVLSACSEVDTDSAHAEVVKEWLKAGQTSQAAAISAVNEYMADDGLFYRPRYVGFGFTYDNTDESGRMIVETIVPGSPASEVLEVGDEFKSVRGIDVTPENRDSGKLSFRGAPGEEVAAVIERGEDTIFVRVKRGKIESTISKADMIEWMSSGDGSDWGAESYTFNEVITDGDVAYGWTTVANKDDVSGQLVESHVVTRFVFNETGEVVAIGSMREDRFELEQQGFSVTR